MIKGGSNEDLADVVLIFVPFLISEVGLGFSAQTSAVFSDFALIIKNLQFICVYVLKDDSLYTPAEEYQSLFDGLLQPFLMLANDFYRPMSGDKVVLTGK